MRAISLLTLSKKCFHLQSFARADGIKQTCSATYETVVVGLGAAGVRAVSELARAGKRVLALEAQDRIGGRVRTEHFGDGLVEVGAEWIHGEHPSNVYETATKNNVSILKDDLALKFYRSDGSVGDAELFGDLIAYGLGVAAEPDQIGNTMANFVTDKLKEYIAKTKPALLNDKDTIDQFLQYMNLLYNNLEASNDWGDVSAYTEWQELEGHQHWSWHRYGFKSYFEILLNKFNNGPGWPNLDVKLSTEVTNITWPSDPTDSVVVTCRDGSSYTAKNVIFTGSVGVLKERHSTLFTPGLPQDKVDAINRIPLGVVDKIILSFPEPWWSHDINYIAFIWRGEDLKQVPAEDYWTTRVFSASRPKGSNNTLTFWTSGEVAKLVETLSEDVVKRKIMEILRRFIGNNVNIPEPTGIIRSSWYSNPFTRGSYTYDSLEMIAHNGTRQLLAAPLLDAAGAPRVLFAGEASHSVYFSTVHGASDTGYREAARLLPTQSKI